MNTPDQIITNVVRIIFEPKTGTYTLEMANPNVPPVKIKDLKAQIENSITISVADGHLADSIKAVMGKRVFEMTAEQFYRKKCTELAKMIEEGLVYQPDSISKKLREIVDLANRGR